MNKIGFPRRDLSGIFIDATLPQDEGQQKPTCIEDCTEDTRLKWLESLSDNKLKTTANKLNACLEYIWMELLPTQRDYARSRLGSKPVCMTSPIRSMVIYHINSACRALRLLGDAFDLFEEDSEASHISHS